MARPVSCHLVTASLPSLPQPPTRSHRSCSLVREATRVRRSAMASHATMRVPVCAARPSAAPSTRPSRAHATPRRHAVASRNGDGSGPVSRTEVPSPLPTSTRGDSLTTNAISPPVLSSLDELEMERGACAIAPKYSPALVRERTLSSPDRVVQTAARGVEIVSAVGMFALGLGFDKFRTVEDVSGRSKDLREKLCKLGPSFVKAGQVLANRPDIVRADYMEQLCKLQDDVPAFPSDQAFAIMENELGVPLTEVFSEISPEPIAAASLGQVYRATLKSSGEQVAVKVQRPGIEPVILRDLVLFRELARFVNTVSIKKLGCNAQLLVDEFGEKLLEELDYVQEGRYVFSFFYPTTVCEEMHQALFTKKSITRFALHTAPETISSLNNPYIAPYN